MPDLQTALEWRTVPDRVVRLFKSHPIGEIKLAMEKKSWNALGELGKYLQMYPGKIMGMVPNRPGVLSSMLVGGLTGAGLGYGTGLLAEHFFPDKWEKGRARRSFALMGGALGVAPGLMWGAGNMMDDRPFFENSESNNWVGTLNHKPLPNLRDAWEEPQAAPRWRAYDPPGTSQPLTGRVVAAMCKEGAAEARSLMLKLADSMTNAFQPIPPVDVNQFNNMVWRDPYVASGLSMPQQAAASGFMSGAANLPGKASTRFVTPMDMGRMAAGMGSGYLSGALVGKALGLALGMPEESQERFRQSGMMAGLIANALPILF